MLKSRENLPLHEETTMGIFHPATLFEYLDGDGHTEVVLPHSVVDLPHAAFADQVDDRIGAYALADQRRRLIRFRRNRLESLIHYFLEESVIRDIGGQQQFQLAAQVVIVTASLRQKGRPVGRREVRGFVKQEFDAVPLSAPMEYLPAGGQMTAQPGFTQTQVSFHCRNRQI